MEVAIDDPDAPTTPFASQVVQGEYDSLDDAFAHLKEKVKTELAGESHHIQNQINTAYAFKSQLEDILESVK